MFEKIKKWYKMNLWTDVMVHNAVSKGIITEDDAAEILNK